MKCSGIYYKIAMQVEDDEWMINYEWPKAPFITHADLVFVIERIEGCNNNPEN